MPLKTEGSKIRELRERKAMTIVEFARRIGYASNSVWMIEADKVNGGPKFIQRATKALDCEVEDIATFVPAETRESA